MSNLDPNIVGNTPLGPAVLGLSSADPGRFGTVEADPTAAAFFDIDNTIVRGASIFALARGLLKKKILTPTDMLGFGWKQAKFILAGTEDLDDIAKIQASALEIIKGQPVSEMRAVADEVFETYMVDKLWPGTLAIAQSHLDMGQQVWLVSATPIEVAEVIAARLGLTGALGTRSAIVDGRYTGELLGVPMHGEAKATAVRELAAELGLDLNRCSAYSDSSNDIPMLSLVGNPVAINPDHELRARARTQGWQIRDYRSRRFALKIGVPAAALIGFGTGLALGATFATKKPVDK